MRKLDSYSKGVGNAATRYDETKRKRYSDIEESEFEFIPFILEAQGGVGKAAITFSKELERRKRLKTCSATRDRSGKLDLLTALNIEVQRFNSTAILEPVPLLNRCVGQTYRNTTRQWNRRGCWP